MGKKTEYRLIQEIECSSQSALICEELKQQEIIKNVKLIRKYKYRTNIWWLQNVLPAILKKHNITNNLTVRKEKKKRI